MSDNYTIVTQPKRWASAHKPIVFKYDMPTETGTVQNSGGFVQITLDFPFSSGAIMVVVGSLVYIETGVHTGYHVVKSVTDQTDFTLETAFISGGSSDIKFATPPQWQIWKGYQDSEVSGTNYFPFTKVADIAPEGNSEGLLEFDVMGYVKSAMPTILAPSEGTSVGSGAFIENERSLYTPYRLLIGVNPESLYFENIYLALNSSIESDTLNAEYLNTDKALNTNAFINSCGTTFLSFLGTNEVNTLRIEGEMPDLEQGFNDDFNNDFFKP